MVILKNGLQLWAALGLPSENPLGAIILSLGTRFYTQPSFFSQSYLVTFCGTISVVNTQSDANSWTK